MKKRIVWPLTVAVLLSSVITLLSVSTIRTEASVNQVSLVSSPIECTGYIDTYFDKTDISESLPDVITFFDYKGYCNVAYDVEEYLKIQRYNKDMGLVDQILISKSYPLFGNVTCDDAGNYYVVWGQEDTNEINDITMSVMKYDYQGNFLGECAYKGYDTWSDYWGTKSPFWFGNCSVTINEGVLAVNYAREMYSGHQSNYILYVDCATMTKLTGPDAYTSHSFGQRMVSVSDGGFLALNHGDVYPRSFTVTKIGADRKLKGEIENFHFREGNTYYQTTYAQLGGIAETNNAYIFCGSSERTLSLNTAPSEGYGHNEARDLFVQILKKDFYKYSGAEQYAVSGQTRKPTGTKPGATDTRLCLTGNEVDYGILWLTDYDDTCCVANPKVVAINGNHVAIMWEKHNYGSYQGVETYYAVLDEKGNIAVPTTQIPGVRLATYIDPVYRYGKIYWATSDGSNEYIYALSPLGEGSAWNYVTGVTVEKSDVYTYPGGAVQVEAAVIPADASDPGLRYSSSNTAVATVDVNGVVTGISPGTAIITVCSKESGEYKAGCVVTVSPTVEKVALSKTEIVLREGSKDYIEINVEPMSTGMKEFNWSVSDATVASVEQKDFTYVAVSGLKEGSVTVTGTAKDGSGVSTKFTVTVVSEADAAGNSNVGGSYPMDLTNLFALYQNYFFVNDRENVRCYYEDGTPVINDFKCDGTYTYYFQADGTAMKDRLTYHPDGDPRHVIYFDENGHEVFSNFANVKKTISGEPVDDYCFFDVYGYLYVDVVTYDKTGTYLYYANPYGVMDRGKWFEFSDNVKWADGTPFDKAGGKYGYANEDGTLLTNTWTYDWEGRYCYMQGNGVALY